LNPMPYRSWLLVPGDSEKKLSKANATGADVIVVDLADSVPVAAKPKARELAAGWLDAHRYQVVERRTARWVRINGLNSRMWRDDLVAVLPYAPEGVILPFASSPDAVRQLAAELYELEQLNQIQAGATKILPLVCQCPESVLTTAAYPEAAIPRLAGLGWNAPDLMRALGATRMRDSRGAWTDAFRFARAQMLLAAHACDALALETLHPNYNDAKGLKVAAKDARADGFTGMFAIHPAQIAEINAIFAASEAELDEARRIVDAYAAGELTQELLAERRTTGNRQLALAKRMLGLYEPRDQEAARGPILRPA
jgi:citrate lyase subunit beta/citryl-CoA lyase